MMEPGSLVLITNRESEDVEEKLPEKTTEKKRIDESFLASKMHQSVNSFNEESLQ